MQQGRSFGVEEVKEEGYLTSTINLIENTSIDRSKGQELVLLLFKASILDEEIISLTDSINKEEDLLIGVELNITGKVIPPLEVILGTKRVIIDKESQGLNLIC